MITFLKEAYTFTAGYFHIQVVIIIYVKFLIYGYIVYLQMQENLYSSYIKLSHGILLGILIHRSTFYVIPSAYNVTFLTLCVLYTRLL